jgi:haloalkane dehalogenase
MFREQFATLTLGSGSVAMVLSRAGSETDGKRYLGGLSRAGTQHANLCTGEVHEMRTDTKGLLLAGLELAAQTWKEALGAFDWDPQGHDTYVVHQVSKTHTKAVCDTLGLEIDRFPLIYPHFGNIGPAACRPCCPRRCRTAPSRPATRSCCSASAAASTPRPPRSPGDGGASAALAGWPYATRSTLVGGHRMAYVDEGAGPPVLLVHGNPTWGFYYRSLLAALPPLGLRAIAPDHIGMGRSEKPSTAPTRTPSRGGSPTSASSSTASALTEPLSLVVHDWGGAIALAWAVDNVERVDKLLVLNTGAFPIPPGKALPWSLAAARVPVLGGIAVRGLNAFSRGALVMGTGRPVLGREARVGLTAPYDSPAHRHAGHEFVRDIPMSPRDPALRRARPHRVALHLLQDKTAVVCWGMQDPVFDEVVLDHLLTLLPRPRCTATPKPATTCSRTPPTASSRSRRDCSPRRDPLARRAARRASPGPPDRTAPGAALGRASGPMTYAALDARVDRVAAGLQHAGLRPGMRTALLVPPTPDFFALTFALTRLRAVPVLVDPGIGKDKVKGCLAEAAPEAFLGIAKAHLARRLLGWAPSARCS